MIVNIAPDEVGVFDVRLNVVLLVLYEAPPRLLNVVVAIKLYL